MVKIDSFYFYDSYMFSNIEIDYKKVNNTIIFFMRQR